MEGFWKYPGRRFEMNRMKQTGTIGAEVLMKEECEAAYMNIRKIYKFEACLNTEGRFEEVNTLIDFGEN